MRYDTVRYDTIRYNTIQYDAVQHDMVQYDMISFIVPSGNLSMGSNFTLLATMTAGPSACVKQFWKTWTRTGQVPPKMSHLTDSLLLNARVHSEW